MWEEDKLKDSALGVCKDMLGGAWNDVTPEELSISQISGGFCNRLYLCRLPSDVETVDDEPRDVVLRIYGSQSGSDVKSKVNDTAIFLLLAERKLGPQLYGIFRDGRLEEYIPSRCATWKDLRKPEVFTDVAKEMAKAHALRVPIKKQPTWLLEQMRSWLDFLENNVSLDELNPPERAIAQQVLDANLGEEINFLETQIQNLKSPAVFSHNDLQGGNVLLLNKKEDKTDSCLMLIDYEFGNYNYRGFDIGNHFCEWCFSYDDPDFPNFSADLQRFPTEEQQRSFIRAYLKQMKEIQPNMPFQREEEEDILREIKVFAPCAHLIWSLWAFYMAQTTSISFSSWHYGKTRLEAYFCQRNRCISSGTFTSVSNASNGCVMEPSKPSDI